jgi:hemerythrin superfamily protein
MSRRHPDALEFLEAEHVAARQLFDAYRELSGNKASGGRRKALAEQICLQLTIHARLEEEIFYPQVREAIRDDDLMDQAQVEHAGARDLIAQILSMHPSDELYDAKVTVLGGYVDHHIAQEREQLFPKVRKAGLDLDALGHALARRRQELQAVPEALREEALASSWA